MKYIFILTMMLVVFLFAGTKLGRMINEEVEKRVIETCKKY